MGAGVAKSMMTDGAILERPENVYFAGRFNVKEKCKRTAHGLAHGAVAVRDASVLGAAGVSAAPASGMLSGTSILAMDGFQAGKANQMLVGMVNFSNMPETAQFVANNHNIAMVGFGLVGAALAWVTKYPVGYLNKRADVAASKQPQSLPASKTAALPDPTPTVVVAPVVKEQPVAKEQPAAVQPQALVQPAVQPNIQAPVLVSAPVIAPEPVITVETRPVPPERIEADAPSVQQVAQGDVSSVQPSAQPLPSVTETVPSEAAPAAVLAEAKPAKKSWWPVKLWPDKLKLFSFNRTPKADTPKVDVPKAEVKVPADAQPAVVPGEAQSVAPQLMTETASAAPHSVAPEKEASDAP